MPEMPRKMAIPNLLRNTGRQRAKCSILHPEYFGITAGR